MKKIQEIIFHPGSKEEILPDFMPDFSYIASWVESDRYMGCFAPWHWHKAVELFYIENGTLEYHTPEGKILFSKGSGGMVNSNILHMTKVASQTRQTTQLLHIFDTCLISGEQGSRIEQKYTMPVITAPQIEIISLHPDHFAQAEILKLIRNSFYLSSKEFGFEVRLRAALSEIWLRIFEQVHPLLDKQKRVNKNNDKIKSLMIYVHEHYSEKISIAELAASAFLSERECFRVFHNCLHITPMEYIKNYRLQMACQMLARRNDSITAISHACGLGSSSYLGKIFREYMNCTPSEYRQKWQDCDI